MESAMTAIETTGTIDEHHQLQLDDSLPISGPRRVRVIVLYPLVDEWDETEWLQAAAGNPVFGFLGEPEEDIYSLTDGTPHLFHHPGSSSDDGHHRVDSAGTGPTAVGRPGRTQQSPPTVIRPEIARD